MQEDQEQLRILVERGDEPSIVYEIVFGSLTVLGLVITTGVFVWLLARCVRWLF